VGWRGFWRDESPLEVVGVSAGVGGGAFLDLCIGGEKFCVRQSVWGGRSLAGSWVVRDFFVFPVGVVDFKEVEDEVTCLYVGLDWKDGI
jgi:hypothetical protein